jgi:beta-glucosidase
LYAFGHGLSFTTFTFGTPRLSATTLGPSETLHVDVDVMNSGTMAGDEVVQLYIRDEVGTITRPLKELRGFRRLTLKPGERTTVRFDLTPWHLSMYDAALKRVVEPGWFSVFVGNSSDAPVAGRVEFRTSDGRPASVADGCPVR